MFKEITLAKSQLRAELKQHQGSQGVAVWEEDAGADEEELIYAVFRTAADPVFAGESWEGAKLMELIEAFESDSRNRPVGNLGRTSAFPRILSLREVLKARRLG